MAPSDIWAEVHGYEMRQRQEWERLRLLGWYIEQYSMADKKSRSPQEFQHFPWDVSTNGVKRVGSRQEVWEEWQKMNNTEWYQKHSSGRDSKNINTG